MSRDNTAEATSLNDIDFSEAFDAVESPEISDDAPINDIEPKDSTETPETNEPEQAEATEPVEQAPELIAPPEYFPKEFKEHFESLQKLEGGRDYAQQWANQYAEHQKFINSKLDEVSKSKQDIETFQQYQQALQPLNQIWQQQAVHPAMGVAQLAHYGQMLYNDPQGLINEIASRANIDLNKFVEEQPYVDPQIAELQRTVQQQQQQFQQTIGQFQQGQSEQQQQAIEQEAFKFRDATGDDGQPLHPHLEQVWQQMQPILCGMEQGRHQSPQAAYKEAYDIAVSMDSNIQAEMQKAQEKAKAEQLHKQAEKASESDTSVNSKSKDAPKVKRDLNNIFDDLLD